MAVVVAQESARRSQWNAQDVFGAPLEGVVHVPVDGLGLGGHGALSQLGFLLGQLRLTRCCRVLCHALLLLTRTRSGTQRQHTRGGSNTPRSRRQTKEGKPHAFRAKQSCFRAKPADFRAKPPSFQAPSFRAKPRGQKDLSGCRE
eukprot:3438742-Pleurochrysis_carterae.AAC.2